MRYDTKITGDEQRDTFPYSVIDTATGRIINSYSHMQIADDVALRMNRPEYQPTSIYDYDEAQEMLSTSVTPAHHTHAQQHNE